MSRYLAVFVAVATLLPAGCSQHYILRMSTPEQSNIVSLLDSGESKGDEDNSIVVIDRPAQIKRAAAFFESRTSKWERLTVAPPVARYEVTFRKGDRVTDRFWLGGNRLCLQTPSGQYFTCDVSDAERAELLNIFRQPAIPQSSDQT